MSEWVGFSDADLRRMKGEEVSKEGPSKPKILKPVTGGRAKPATSVGQKQQRRPNVKTSLKQAAKARVEVPQAAMLSKKLPANETQKEQRDAPVTPPGTPNDQIPLHGKTFSPVTESSEPQSDDSQKKAKEPEIVEDTEVIQRKEKLKLEDIQRRQKEMEEKNKRKKTMLTKAIAERKKKAFAESTKLVKIQAELAKLDDMLNYDVSILRDRIDQACWEFNNAQKRFEKAETEYIDAKMQLHKATDMKEELTEHLYQLIQLNEERKANKLEELMHKLQLEDEGEENTEQNADDRLAESKPDTASTDSKRENTILPESSDNAAVKVVAEDATTEKRTKADEDSKDSTVAHPS